MWWSALAVELACACQLKPGLEVFGYRALQQGVLGVARVVELGFGARVRIRTRMRMRVLSCFCAEGAAGAWCSAWMGLACGMKL